MMRSNRTIPHAVSSAGANSYSYDCNGNMTSRNIGGQNYTLTYDAENRLTAVSGAATASFTYDGAGNQVKGTVGGVTTVYVGNYFEWICRRSLRSLQQTIVGSINTMVKYYYAGSTRVATRTGAGANETGLLWLFGDHFCRKPRQTFGCRKPRQTFGGSTSRVANADGTPYTNGEQRYKPWGEKRYPTGASGLLTTAYSFRKAEESINAPRTGKLKRSGSSPGTAK